MAEEIERLYVIPLKKKGYKSSKAAPTAVRRVKDFLTHHMKVKPEEIWIDDSLNNALWSKGKYNMPSRIRVKAVKFEDGIVEAYLPELEFKKSRREILKEEREKKTPILRREEEMPEGDEGTGADDYDIAPTADGDVKIKKKKSKKPKEETKDKTEKKETTKDKKETKEKQEKVEKTEKKEEKTEKENKKTKEKETTSKKKTEETTKTSKKTDDSKKKDTKKTSKK